MLGEAQLEKGEQAEQLIPKIEALLSDADMDYAALDALAATTGPGGFTGVKIGLAALKGIQLATSLPLIGVSVFEALAWQLREEYQHICIVLDARRGEVFMQRFTLTPDIIATSDPELVPIEAVEYASDTPLHIISNCWEGLAEHVPQEGAVTLLQKNTYPTARDVAGMAAWKIAHGDDEQPAEPLYIRPPDAKLPSKRA